MMIENVCKSTFVKENHYLKQKKVTGQFPPEPLSLAYEVNDTYYCDPDQGLQHTTTPTVHTKTAVHPKTRMHGRLRFNFGTKPDSVPISITLDDQKYWLNLLTGNHRRS